jgi:hypothetical protein
VKNKVLLAALAVAVLAVSAVLVYALWPRTRTSAPPMLTETFDLSALTDPSKGTTIIWVNDSDRPFQGTLVGAGENLHLNLTSSVPPGQRATSFTNGPLTIEELRIERGDKKTLNQPKTHLLPGHTIEIHIGPDDSVRLDQTPK